MPEFEAPGMDVLITLGRRVMLPSPSVQQKLILAVDPGTTMIWLHICTYLQQILCVADFPRPFAVCV